MSLQLMFLLLWLFFFFQAEDGIRDTSVTGVQTCALPIWIFGVRRREVVRFQDFPLVGISEALSSRVALANHVKRFRLFHLIKRAFLAGEIGRASCRERV